MVKGSVTCSCDDTPEITNIGQVGDHWEYTITCESACGPRTETGRVNIEPPCLPTSTPFEVCTGETPTVDDILSNGSVSCGSGYCDTTPLISDIHMVGDHWEYTITCTTALGCEATVIGRVNIQQSCVPTSTPYTICSTETPTEEDILAKASVSCGSGYCDTTPKISFIHMVGDHWEYLITCTTDLGCIATATGRVNIVQECGFVSEPTAFDIPEETNCPDILPTDKQIIDLAGLKCSCPDTTPAISNVHWIGEDEEGVLIGEYNAFCGSEEYPRCGATIVGRFNNRECIEECNCTPTAPNLCSCVGFGFPQDMFDSYEGGCHKVSGCDITPTMELDLTGVDFNNVGLYDYTVKCLGCRNSPVTGKIHIDYTNMGLCRCCPPGKPHN